MTLSKNMDIIAVRENISRAREKVGWVYSDLKWLSDKEAIAANRALEHPVVVAAVKAPRLESFHQS